MSPDPFIGFQFDVSTTLTSAFNHLLCFNLIRRAKKVSKLINHPVVCLLAPEWAYESRKRELKA
jgi:hypothetical protein